MQCLDRAECRAMIEQALTERDPDLFNLGADTTAARYGLA
jgi:hypothetical protein